MPGQLIPMPDQYFTWSTDNVTCAAMDTATGLASGLQLGHTHVEVANVRLPENRVRGVLKVVEPGYLELHAAPAGNVQ